MKRTILLLTVMATTVMAYAGSALAQISTAEILDANTLGLGASVNAYTAVPGHKAVQTFTAEHNGKLTTAKFKIHLDSAWGSIDGANVQITTVDPATGLPTSNVLASSTIPSSDIPVLPVNIDPASIPMTTVTFGSPATVEAGKQYAIVMDTIASNTDIHFLRWTTTLQDYSGGQGMWINDDGSFARFLPAQPERDNASDQVFAIYIATPDTTPPSVTNAVPKANATQAAPTVNVRATFSEEMDSNTINDTTFQLFKKGTTIQIPATVSYNADTDTAKLDPTNNLRRGVAYKAVVTTEAKDVEGNRLDQDGSTSGLQQMRWFFRVDD